MILNCDLTGLKPAEYKSGKVQKILRLAHEKFRSNTLEGTGFVELVNTISNNEITAIKHTAKFVNDNADVLVVIGIGGSYLGAYSAIKMLKRRPKTEVRFVGTNFSAYEMQDLLEYIKDKRVCVNVISKSGTTLESLLAFNLIEQLMMKKYKKKDEFKQRIFVTTDAQKGYLKEYADKMGYQKFVVPDNVGGRYSVLSAVGLLPMAVAGINITKVLEGAKQSYKDCFVFDIDTNPAYKYAVTRFLMQAKERKLVEVLCNFDTRLIEFGEWYKQLFAESEGKDKKGLFVSSLNYSTDLHSFGQYIQEGTPMVFETFIKVKEPETDIVLSGLENSPVPFLNGKSLEFVNKSAELGTIKSHINAKVPIVQIELDKIDEETYGYLVYFFETACAMSGLMIGVNPFNQPGVEGYKSEMRQIMQK